MQTVDLPAFAVSGPNVRTTNAAEFSADGKIPGLWAQFHASNPDLSRTLYGVYSDYESDLTGAFTVTAGIEADDAAQASVAVEAGTYLAFPAEGDMPGALIAAWKAVWEHFSGGHPQPHVRAYRTDFEAYTGPRSATIYIGVKAAG